MYMYMYIYKTEISNNVQPVTMIVVADVRKDFFNPH